MHVLALLTPLHTLQGLEVISLLLKLFTCLVDSLKGKQLSVVVIFLGVD
jgi:hypothetical protein